MYHNTSIFNKRGQMSQENGFLIIAILCLFVILGAFCFAMLFLKNKNKESKDEPQEDIPTPKDLIVLLENKKNTLKELEHYSQIALKHYRHYMQQMPNFDLEFLIVLVAHKSVNAKLILEVERFFKSSDPNRVEVIEKALGVGLKGR